MCNVGRRGRTFLCSAEYTVGFQLVRSRGPRGSRDSSLRFIPAEQSDMGSLSLLDWFPVCLCGSWGRMKLICEQSDEVSRSAGRWGVLNLWRVVEGHSGVTADSWSRSIQREVVITDALRSSRWKTLVYSEDCWTVNAKEIILCLYYCCLTLKAFFWTELLVVVLVMFVFICVGLTVACKGLGTPGQNLCYCEQQSE